MQFQSHEGSIGGNSGINAFSITALKQKPALHQ
jgi:hypothetical protein